MKHSNNEKILDEIVDIVKNYTTPEEKEILTMLQQQNSNDKVDDEIMNKLIHNQHQDFLKYKK